MKDVEGSRIWKLQHRSPELQLWLAKQGIECDFWFLRADKIRHAKSPLLKSHQDIREHHSEWLEELPIRFEDACAGRYCGKASDYSGERHVILAVSHRWEDSSNPDPMGIQAHAVQKYLVEHPEITHVFFE